MSRIRPKDRDAILQSLSAGVVPRRGHQHIQVGRVDEIRALMRDLERIADGGAAVRFVIGRYGSGKTFFMHLVRAIGLEQGLVSMHADLAPDRRLQASGGQAQNLYQELAINVATRTSPEGNALQSVVERFISRALSEAGESGRSVSEIMNDRLGALSEMVGGYDFATVIQAYWIGHDEGRAELKGHAVRWLRGEYQTKTDAKRDLGVRTYVDDNSLYDHLKLFARFVRLAGYDGLLVSLDEMVNLYKISHTQSRQANYEQILRMVNDCLQGSVRGLGFMLGGTPEFLMDPRRGLYSYEALQTRLQENAFASDELRDFSGPVIRLPNLSEEELYVLLSKLRNVQSGGDPERHLVPDQALSQFMQHCSQRIGAEYFQTPRNTIKAFVQMLAILEQNAEARWQDLIGNVPIENDSEPDATDSAAADGDELASFQI